MIVVTTTAAIVAVTFFALLAGALAGLAFWSGRLYEECRWRALGWWADKTDETPEPLLDLGELQADIEAWNLGAGDDE
ncbi:MAG TPA: hypothetical protein VF244_09235 [Acidimicrobiales bacterium]